MQLSTKLNERIKKLETKRTSNAGDVMLFRVHTVGPGMVNAPVGELQRIQSNCQEWTRCNDETEDQFTERVIAERRQATPKGTIICVGFYDRANVPANAEGRYD